MTGDNGHDGGQPRIGVTMGDPAGIGPEIIIKALREDAVWERCRPIVIGDAGQLRRAADLLGQQIPITVVSSPSDAPVGARGVFVVQTGEALADLPLGRVSAPAGDAAYHYVVRAVELAQAGALDAICTAPLNKEALHAAGHLYPGHTELLGELTGRKDFAMVLMGPDLRVAHVTTHVGLRKAIDLVTRERVETVIGIGAELMQRIGIATPRIAVCGLNPHAGENGLFGEGEEEREITPAVQHMRARGIDVHGPLPADTVFFRARRGDFDLVIAQYHDQGHGPMKVLGLEAGVNVTAGLPLLRTSVDHGTAFDIAGKGVADAGSLVAAITLAAQMAREAARR